MHFYLFTISFYLIKSLYLREPRLFMRNNQFTSLFFLLFTGIGLSCNVSYQSRSLAYKTYHISSAAEKDPAVHELLQPYSDSVNKSMNDIVGVADQSLDKKLPECTLGNFMVDAFFIMAGEKYNTPVDAAFLNYGGIRLT